jgi:hypothetical protein
VIFHPAFYVDTTEIVFTKNKIDMLHKDTKNKKIDANFQVTLQVCPLTSHSPSRSMNTARSPDGMNTARSGRSSDGMNTARSTDSKFNQLEIPLVTMATVFQQYGDLVHYKQVLCICVGSLSFSSLLLSLAFALNNWRACCVGSYCREDVHVNL